MAIYSYVVRYDSGFAPNPFYGYCTLATCKPAIRKSVQIGDWVVGSGSNNKKVKLGGYLVYAMRVTEIVDFCAYSEDPRFQKKKPFRFGSRKQSCGDNIYFRHADDADWEQLDSFHTNNDGTPNQDHIARDTSVDRVLISSDFVYFGGYGPEFPKHLRKDICKEGIGRKRITEEKIIEKFVHWIRALGEAGYISAPFEWKVMRG